MSQELRSQALEAISWRLEHSAFGKLRVYLDLDAESIIQYFMDRIEQGDMITEQEWLETQEVEA